jgi:membrane protein
VYWTAPSHRKSSFRAVTPGASVAMAVLLVASIGYDVYVTRFASYKTTYGAELDELLEERAQER